uniref:Erythropoietin n=1 Tax=Melopsittacus undulatus TaxID=13146 RepID=A0A8V5GUF1_MELUD
MGGDPRGGCGRCCCCCYWGSWGTPRGPPPLCDPRVLEWFILEARDMEKALVGCGPRCELPEALPVPYPGVNFNEWPRLEAAARAGDVRGGVASLAAAAARARELLAADARMRPLLERANSGARSLARLLRDMTAQVRGGGAGPRRDHVIWGAGPMGGPCVSPPHPPPPRQWQVRSLDRLLAVHSSFLHGKVRLFLMDACGQPIRH